MGRREPRGTPYIRFNLLHEDSDRYRVWAAFRDRLMAAPEVAVEGGPAARVRRAKDTTDEQGTIVLWRLMSSNHREIATSGAGFPTVDAARAHVEVMMGRASRLIARQVVDGVQERFAWTLHNRTVVALIAGRWHPSRRDVVVSLALAREALARADVVETPIETRPLAVVKPRRRDDPRVDRRLSDAPVIEAGAARPIKDIRRYNELGRGSR